MSAPLFDDLRPEPGRLAAALRITVACVVASLLTMAFHIPEGHWLAITIFSTSQANAGASLTRGVQRIAGTVVGGVIGILSISILADQPWTHLPLLAAFAMAGLFLSRTTTAPYASLLAGVTALMVTANVGFGSPTRALEIGLWRIALIALGVAIGTAAQLLLWPADPERELLESLAARLDRAAGALRRILAGTPGAPAQLGELIDRGLTHQLDLIADAETRHPALRTHHIAQLTLITAVEHLLTDVLALEQAAPRRTALGGDGATSAPLAVIAERCDVLAAALRARQPPPEAPAVIRGPTRRDDPVLVALAQAGHAMAFLDAGAAGDVRPDAAPSPLDAPTGGFFTPACSPYNHADLVFAAKGGLAAAICAFVAAGTTWPGIETSLWTCVLVSQASLGSLLQKARLRLVGATAGGLLGLVALTVVMPNITTLGAFLVMVAAGTGLAAWVAVGSPRVAYAGLQIGLAFAMCVGDRFGPAIDLAIPRDRVLGILLGNVVTAVVFAGSGHVRAAVMMVAQLGTTLRSLASLATVGLSGPEGALTTPPARGWRWKVYQDIAATLRLTDEASFEPGALAAGATRERTAVSRTTAEAQGVFLALLAVVRHRISAPLDLPETTRAPLRALARGIEESLRGGATALGGGAPIPPDLPALRAAAEGVRAEVPPTSDAGRVLSARLGLYDDLLPLVMQLDADATRHGIWHGVGRSAIEAPIPAPTGRSAR